MGTLVSKLITRTRRRINETSTTFHKDADMIAYADEAQRYIINETRPLEATSVSTIDSTQDSPEQYDFPDDFIAMRRITLNGFDLFRTTFSEIREAEIREADQNGLPTMWYEWNDVIYLLPIPGSGNDGEELKLFYYKNPIELTATTDEMELDTRWDSAIIPYMAYLAWIKDEEPDFADYQLTECNAKMKSRERKQREDKLDRPPRFRVSDNLNSRYPMNAYSFRRRYISSSSGYGRRR